MLNVLPARPPEPVTPGGFLASARERTDDGWQRGFEISPTLRATAGQLDGTQDACGPLAAVDVVDRPPFAAFRPVLFRLRAECSTMGAANADPNAAEVQAAVTAATEHALSREFLYGTVTRAATDPNPYLAAPGVVDLTPAAGAVSVKAGAAILEQALSEAAGGRAMIHVPPALAEEVPSRREGRLLLTKRDTIVVAAPGYSGAGVDGAAPAGDTVYLYGSDLVDYWLGAVGEPVVWVDASVNLRTTVADRMGAVGFDALRRFAVRVDPGFPIRGSLAAPTV